MVMAQPDVSSRYTEGDGVLVFKNVLDILEGTGIEILEYYICRYI